MYSRGNPHIVPMKNDETIYICQCGHTKTPPYCDGSHNQHPGKTPLAHTATEDGPVYICGCGKSANKPWCDGSHSA